MADAYTRIYPDLVQLTLPRGVLDIEKNIPPGDVALIANVNRVLVRSDLHPEIVYLLSKAMLEEHSEPGIFTRPGEFPKSTDPEYPLHASAVEFYKNGPSFMQRHIPLWLSAHIQRLIAVVATVIAVIIPLFHYLPMLYRWTVRRRLLYWYGRLQALEASIDSNSSGKHLTEVQIELQRIDEAVSRIHFPLAFSDQVSTCAVISKLFDAEQRLAKTCRLQLNKISPHRHPLQSSQVIVPSRRTAPWQELSDVAAAFVAWGHVSAWPPIGGRVRFEALGHGRMARVNTLSPGEHIKAGAADAGPGRDHHRFVFKST